MHTDFKMPADLLKSSPTVRLQALSHFATALDLNGVTIDYSLHKAAKGETIKAPHLNPAIWELEQEFYDLWDSTAIVGKVLDGIGVKGGWFGMQKAKSVRLYREDGEPLTPAEMTRLEKIIADALGVSKTKVSEIILKSAAAAKVASQDMMGIGTRVDISMLPKTLQEAIKVLKLNPAEVNAIRYAFQYAAMNITNITARAQSKIQNMVVESIQSRMSSKYLANKMFTELAVNDNSVLNRDWERIAITETNRAANDGYLASQSPGSYVIGDSHDDACQYCNRMINMRIYKVTDDPPAEYGHLDPTSKKYQALAKRWDTEVWPGKSNVGRSLSARKQSGGHLVNREHHERGVPTLPLHPHCLTGDSLVSPRGTITSVSKRWFDGNVIVLKSAEGRELTCTPNHPILGSEGFIAAGVLNIGDTVVSDGISKWESNLDRDNINRPSSIKDIVESFLDSPEVIAAPVPITPEDFHGDGFGSEVAIIGTNSLLRDGNNTTRFKHTLKNNLIFTDIKKFLFDGFSTFTFLSKRLNAILSGFMSRLDLFGSLLGSHLLPFKFLRLGLITELDTNHFEPSGNSGAGNFELLREGIDRSAGKIESNNFSDGQINPDMIASVLAGEILGGSKGEIFFDKIVHIETKPFSGYVYNIETTEGYYIANGITTHNCRCRYSEWIPELFYIKDGRTEFAVDDKSIKEHAEFLKKNPHIKIGK